MPVGTKVYYDQVTGKPKEFQLNEKEIRDYNFYKYWPENLADFKRVATLKERDFFDWLVQHANSGNLVLGTYGSIAKDIKHSTRFVEKAIHKLMNTNVIVKVQNGAYLLNPNVIFKGTTSRRKYVAKRYEDFRNQQRIHEEKRATKQLK